MKVIAVYVGNHGDAENIKTNCLW